MPGRNGAFAFWLKDIDDLLGEYLLGVHAGLVSADGTGKRFIADGLDPTFSPNGRMLAISAEPARGGIVLRRLDGRQVRRLTTADDHGPTWSPSGRRVAYARLHCEESVVDYAPPVCSSQGIYAIGVDGRDEQVLAGDGLEPAWSSTGELAFVRSTRPYWLGGTSPGEGGIHVVGEDGIPRQIVPRGSSPDWSPQGDRLVFRRRTGHHWALFVVGADGSGLRRLLATRDRLASPVWSPDGERIAFLQRRAVFSISPAGRNYRRLFGRLSCGPCDGAEGADGIAWQPRR
ncbi:MAG TPA: hypothetical protein VF072_08965 [Thermoleophilaceae bacterium]